MKRVKDDTKQYKFTALTAKTLYIGDVNACNLGLDAFKDWTDNGMKDGVYDLNITKQGAFKPYQIDNVFAVVLVEDKDKYVDTDGNVYRGFKSGVWNIGIVDLSGINYPALDELRQYGKVIEFKKDIPVICSLTKDEDSVYVNIRGRKANENIVIMSADVISDSRKIKDETKLTKNGKGNDTATGVAFKYKGERKLNKSEVDELDKVVKDWSKEKFGENIFDSRKIKDADETQDVLDGILMIAFNDGSEDEGYNEVKKHANEQGELEGVQYETYDTDNQDGVTLIDLCAATDDANAFVKALLTEWGIIDAVADIEFEKSELMENAEVSDSRRVSDYRSPLDAIENAFNSVANELGTEQLSPKFYEKVNKYIKTYPIAEGGNSCTIVYQGAKYDVSYDFRDNRFYASKDEWNLSEAIEKRRKLLGVSDSKVEDMTKPVHLRGYAEKYRKKRREQKESYKENEEETQDKEVTDSRRIKDSDDEYLLQEIANQLEEGYHSGYDPQWDIDITVDGADISEFNDDDKDLIYQDIAYVVKDGYDNYMGIETELSDGSIVYVDFVLNY